MLIEIAIGDAYGAGFEFAPRAKIDRHNEGAGHPDQEHVRQALEDLRKVCGFFKILGT